MRQNRRARERNRQQRTNLRSVIKKVRAAATGAEAAAALRSAEAIIDRAARKRLIHPNAAARQKARLAQVVKKKQG
jgi:small subunit ribosomal protein S20